MSHIEAFNNAFEEVKKVFLKGTLKKTVKFKENKIFLSYLNRPLEIDLTSANFNPEIEYREKILVLHYICKDSQIYSEEMITFKNLPEGPFYYPSIYSRIYLPLIEKYGKDVEGFVKKMIEVGGGKISEFSVKLNIFSDVFFIFEIIPEDEEFPPDLKIFFNKKASDIFEIEDLVIIGEIIVSKLV